MFSFFVTCTFSVLFAKHEEKSFLSWMRRTNQFFTDDEYHLRFGIFLSNSRRVQEFNSAHKSFKVSVNKFACYTPSEYRILLGLRRHVSTSNRQKIVKKAAGNEPDYVDWREKGIVNEIKNQGQCGSCWAFGSIQACESAYALAHGTLNSCSEQNLIDCVPNCYGCNGGFPTSAVNYVILNQAGQFNSESDYPYKAVEENCKYDASKAINKILSWESGKAGDEDYLKTLVSKGVCAIGIDAAAWSFQSYSSGIYDEPECSSEFLDHSVGLVGYGTENGVDYWIVRNSWGTDWGEKGYIRMSRNKDNQCGVATDTFQVYA